MGGILMNKSVKIQITLFMIAAVTYFLVTFASTVVLVHSFITYKKIALTISSAGIYFERVLLMIGTFWGMIMSLKEKMNNRAVAIIMCLPFLAELVFSITLIIDLYSQNQLIADELIMSIFISLICMIYVFIYFTYNKKKSDLCIFIICLYSFAKLLIVSFRLNLNSLFYAMNLLDWSFSLLHITEMLAKFALVGLLLHYSYMKKYEKIVMEELT